MRPPPKGWFISGYLHALSAQAVALGSESPESHEAAAEAERTREAAYVEALEDRADYWSCTDPEPDPRDDITGSISGHTDQEGGPMQVYLGDPGLDDTYMN
jgi:hypothetical protein